MINLSEIRKKVQIDNLYIAEIKIDDYFADRQFEINGYLCSFLKRDIDNGAGEKIVFIKQSLIVNRLKELQNKISETIFRIKHFK